MIHRVSLFPSCVRRQGGMDVNLIAKFNHETPLHLAASWNRCETIELLLDARANIDAGTKVGCCFAVDTCGRA